MAKKHIDELTNEQLDYAVAVTQGFTLIGGMFVNNQVLDKSVSFMMTNSFPKNEYNPTTNQAQCGELIDKFRINCEVNAFSANTIWKCFIYPQNKKIVNESRLVASCKAFLWSKYPDGMIPTEEIKNE